MTTPRGSLAAAMIAGCLAVGACGPLRFDSQPGIRGTVATVHARAVGIRHKTGRTFRVELTPDTRIIDRTRPGGPTLCAGQRVTVLLASPGQFTASSVTVWGGEARDECVAVGSALPR